MQITTYKSTAVETEINEWDIASSVPAWMFSSAQCQKCHWGINEDNRGDIMTQTVVVARYKKKDYVFHDACFKKDENVKRWIR